MLAARNLTVGYHGATVLTDASVEVTGKRTALLGANGSGKTTLMNALAGAVRPTQGEVLLDGVPVSYGRAGLRTHRRHVQLVLQDPDHQLFSADVTQDVSFGPLNLGLSEEATRERVDETLAQLGITHLAQRPTHQLSYGERKRVALAGAVAMRPRILLLDEPTAGLDPVGVVDLLDTLTALDAGLLIATHDIPLALEWADEVAIVIDGAIVQGPANLLTDRDLLVAARLQKADRP